MCWGRFRSISSYSGQGWYGPWTALGRNDTAGLRGCTQRSVTRRYTANKRNYCISNRYTSIYFSTVAVSPPNLRCSGLVPAKQLFRCALPWHPFEKSEVCEKMLPLSSQQCSSLPGYAEESLPSVFRQLFAYDLGFALTVPVRVLRSFFRSLVPSLDPVVFSERFAA
jgi:hypothetical protein